MTSPNDKVCSIQGFHGNSRPEFSLHVLLSCQYSFCTVAGRGLIKTRPLRPDHAEHH